MVVEIKKTKTPVRKYTIYTIDDFCKHGFQKGLCREDCQNYN